MLIKSVKIGDRVEIYQRGDNLDSRPLVSQVEDIISEAELMIHTPVSFGQLVRLAPQSRHSLLFYTADKGMLRFDSEVLSHRSENELSFTLISIRSEGEKIQRRSFYRFACLLPLKFSVTEGEPHPYLEGVIKDIGGGGMRFVSNAEISENSAVSSVLMLNDEFLSIGGKVLNKQFFPKSNFKYQYRVEFSQASKDEQDRILKYIFFEERKLMKKTGI